MKRILMTFAAIGLIGYATYAQTSRTTNRQYQDTGSSRYNNGRNQTNNHMGNDTSGQNIRNRNNHSGTNQRNNNGRMDSGTYRNNTSHPNGYNK